jgi:hypothetical protein
VPRRLLPFLLVLTALGAVACGAEEDSLFDAKGFGITFEYPEGFEESDDVSIAQQRGSQADDSRAVGLDEDNGIIVQRYSLQQSINEDNLELAKAEFDALVAQLSPDAGRGRVTEVAGLPAINYEDIPVESVDDGQSRLVVVFDGRTEYLLNCQSTPKERSKIEDACDLAVETLAVKGS